MERLKSDAIRHQDGLLIALSQTGNGVYILGTGHARWFTSLVLNHGYQDGYINDLAQALEEKLKNGQVNAKVAASGNLASYHLLPPSSRSMDKIQAISSQQYLSGSLHPENVSRHSPIQSSAILGGVFECSIPRRTSDPTESLRFEVGAQFLHELGQISEMGIRDPRRSEAVKSLKIRFKMQCFDYRHEAAEPENLEMALRGYLELLKEGQSIPRLPSLSDSPRIYLPRLNRLTLDLSKALGLRLDPSKLFDKSLREHIHPFLNAHANLITAFSLSTPRDDPQIGDACFLDLPDFPSLETLSIHVYLDRSSTWDGASRFLRQHSTKLKKLKVILSQRHLSQRRNRESIVSPPSSHDWTKRLFWSIPMPALTEFQLFNDIIPLEGGQTPDFQLTKSSPLLERLILSKPMSTPEDLEELIKHLSSSDSAHGLKELLMPKAELDLLGLKSLARGLPQLRRLSVHSIDLKMNLDGVDSSVLDETTARAARGFSSWALEQFDFRHVSPSNGDSVKYRYTITAILPNVRLFQGLDKVLWADGWVDGSQEV